MRHQRFAGSLLIGVSVGLLACGGNAETQAAPEEMQGMELNVEFVSMLAQAQRAIGTNSIDTVYYTHMTLPTKRIV